MGGRGIGSRAGKNGLMLRREFDCIAREGVGEDDRSRDGGL